MLPKKKFDYVRKTRKIFMLQRLIYCHLDRKTREFYVEESNNKEGTNNF
jgi:hypothetical protein